MKNPNGRKGGPGLQSMAALVFFLLASTAVSALAEPAVPGFVWLPGGTFTMGSNAPDANADEKPAHSVTVSGFYLGKYEVTRGEWFDVIATRPWLMDDGITPREGVVLGATEDEDDAYPASYISWTQAMAWCAAKNVLAGNNWYRLPTEAEWEYAARVGNLGSLMTYSPEITVDNLANYAWFHDNTIDVGEAWPHPTGIKLPTKWGLAATEWLYDMHGNVSEWVLDYYGAYSSSAQTNPSGASTGVGRVRRGGAFTESGYIPPGSDCSSANREFNAVSITNKAVGFRVLRQLNPYTYLPGQGGSDGGTVVVKPKSSEGGGGGGCFIKALFP